MSSFLTNNLGEIIATETLENAANVYGIGGNRLKHASSNH